MRRLTVTGIDVAAVEQAVVPGAYAKGARYAQQQAVLHMEWDDEEQSLSGLVRGSSRKVYHASVYFDLDSDGCLHFNVGECSCPVEMDCEHAVAVALTAAGPPGYRGPGRRPPEPPDAELGTVAGHAVRAPGWWRRRRIRGHSPGHRADPGQHTHPPGARILGIGG